MDRMFRLMKLAHLGNPGALCGERSDQTLEKHRWRLRSDSSIDLVELKLPPRNSYLDDVSAIFTDEYARAHRPIQVVVKPVRRMLVEAVCSNAVSSDGNGTVYHVGDILVDDVVSLKFNEVPKDRAVIVYLPALVEIASDSLHPRVCGRIDLVEDVSNGA